MGIFCVYASSPAEGSVFYIKLDNRAGAQEQPPLKAYHKVRSIVQEAGRISALNLFQYDPGAISVRTLAGEDSFLFEASDHPIHS